MGPLFCGFLPFTNVLGCLTLLLPPFARLLLQREELPPTSVTKLNSTWSALDTLITLAAENCPGPASPNLGWERPERNCEA